MSEDGTEPGEGPLRSTWRPLIPIYVTVTLFSAGEQALHVLVSPYLSERLGQGTASIGMVVAVFGVAALIARMPVGALYRFDRALAMLVVGGAFSAGAFALVPLVDHPLPFAALMAADGVGWALVTTTQLALLVATRPAGLPTAGAMAWYSGTQGIGHTLGGVGAGVLADTLGYEPAFLAFAAVPAVATVVMVAALRRPAGAAVVQAPGGGDRGRELRGAWGTIGSMPAVVWAGVLVMVYINFVNGFVNTFHPVLALSAGLSLTAIGTLATCRSFASSAVRLGSGPMFSRSARPANLTAPLAILSAVAVVAIPSVASSFVLQVPIFFAIGLSRGLLRITGSAAAFDGVGDDERQHGLTAALLNAGLDFGKVAGPIVGGFVGEAAGLANAFRIVPLTILAAYVVVEAAARRRARATSQPAATRP
ncbi:MAG: MFS transporter [Nitriliruptorales bacterium]